jgi:hypothetical protein
MYKHFLQRGQQKLLASLQREGRKGNNRLWNIAALVPRAAPLLMDAAGPVKQRLRSSSLSATSSGRALYCSVFTP